MKRTLLVLALLSSPLFAQARGKIMPKQNKANTVINSNAGNAFKANPAIVKVCGGPCATNLQETLSSEALKAVTENANSIDAKTLKLLPDASMQATILTGKDLSNPLAAVASQKNSWDVTAQENASTFLANLSKGEVDPSRMKQVKENCRL